MEINYEDLYFNQEVVLKIGYKEYECSIQIRDFSGRPDCQIGHFGYNFFFRTPYGVKMKKYKSVESMKRSIAKCVKNNNMEVIKWIDKNS